MPGRLLSGATRKASQLAGQLARAKRRVKELKIQLELYERAIPASERHIYEENAKRSKDRETAAFKKWRRDLREKRLHIFGG